MDVCRQCSKNGISSISALFDSKSLGKVTMLQCCDMPLRNTKRTLYWEDEIHVRRKMGEEALPHCWVNSTLNSPNFFLFPLCPLCPSDLLSLPFSPFFSFSFPSHIPSILASFFHSFTCRNLKSHTTKYSTSCISLFLFALSVSMCRSLSSICSIWLCTVCDEIQAQQLPFNNQIVCFSKILIFFGHSTNLSGCKRQVKVT